MGDISGGRGKRHSRIERVKLLSLIAEARAAGARLFQCCLTIGIDPRTIQRWKNQGADGGADKRKGPIKAPANKLSAKEVDTVLKTINAKEYADLNPKQIVPLLADREIYLCSESTMYKILREHNLLKHRRRAKKSTKRVCKEHVATGPNQVWSWDITYLHSPVPGVYFFLYMVMDIWSRKIVGWTIKNSENGEDASVLMTEIVKGEHYNYDELVVHSDNGAPMKSGTLLATFQNLGIAPSNSRPRVSNDNPFSESAFGTMKGRPEYPSSGRFKTIEAAMAWTNWFVNWYNKTHLHGGIQYVTPEQRHSGRYLAILKSRTKVFEEAKRRNSNRWAKETRNWDPMQKVVLNKHNKKKILKQLA